MRHFSCTATVFYVAIFVSFFIRAVSAFAQCEAVIVTNGGYEVYETAAQGIRDNFRCSFHEERASDGARQIIRDIDRINPHFVFALGDEALDAVSTVRDIPVFYTLAFGRKPAGGNFHGVTVMLDPRVYIGLLERMKAHRVGVLYHSRQILDMLEGVRSYANKKRIALKQIYVSESSRVDAALASLNGDIDALWLVPDSGIVNPEFVKSLMLYSFTAHVPVVAFSLIYAQSGAVAAADSAPYDMGAQLGYMAKGLLSGEDVPSLSHPDRVRYYVNAEVAGKMGLALDERLHRYAIARK